MRQIPENFKEVPGLTPNGYKVYYTQDDSTGIRQYISDEVGGGIIVHSTLVDQYTVLHALLHERTLQIAEYYKNKQKELKIKDLPGTDQSIPLV